MKDKQICWVERTNETWGGAEKLELERRKGTKGFLLNSMGTDHFPVKLARELGFTVKWLSDYSSSIVAQNGFKLLHELNSKINDTFVSEFDNKEALIIGSDGNIGRKVLKIAEGYGIDAIGYDIKDHNNDPERMLRWLRNSKFIFFCCDLNPSSKDYFRISHYKAMKNKPLIINVVGRLELLDLNRLETSLALGLVSGYACGEIPDHPIRDRIDCIFTEHNGWKSKEAIDRRIEAQKKVWTELLDVKV